MTTNNISIQDLVHREVIYCVSCLVYTLTQENKLEAEQAIELWTAIDWDEAEQAISDKGLVIYNCGSTYSLYVEETNQAYYNPSKIEIIKEYFDSDLSDYEREPLEHWLVSTWLGNRLEEKGETIVRDFYGLDAIWCRCCSGQSIWCDYVIQEIYSELVHK